MKNLIKAQLYQIRKTRVYLWVFVFFTAMAMIFGAAEYLSGADSLDDGQLLTASDFATRMGMTPNWAMIGMAFFTAFICADDFSDKTCNYELMSGRMRKQAYLARALTAVTVSVLFGMFMMSVSLVMYTLLTGWGNSISVGAALTRILLMAFPFFRLSCLLVLLSYIIKKPALVIVVLYGLITLMSMISENAADPASVLTAISNLTMLSHYDMWATAGFENTAYYMYDPSLGATKILSTIAASLAAGGAYLAVGFSYFHGDDLE